MFYHLESLLELAKCLGHGNQGSMGCVSVDFTPTSLIDEHNVRLSLNLFIVCDSCI